MSTLSSRARLSGKNLDWASSLRGLADRLPIERRSLFGLIILGALLAFEIFNYGTTEFALTDLLGDLRFAGIRWSTILALAFCSMDFAGIARLFTPEQDPEKPVEVWYLLGAWLLAATMNAMLTWWAVSLALIGHQGLGNEVIGREALLGSVPFFVAILVWLIRILIIGTFTITGEKVFSRKRARRSGSARSPQFVALRHQPSTIEAPEGIDRPARPAPKPVPRRDGNYRSRPIAAQPLRRS
jgi:hypothetical protein